jgi:23S rRNA (guanosine2251-2'-O)-methyltransferase
MVVYGINPVAEALRAGCARRIHVARRDDRRVQRLLDEARSRGVPVVHVTPDALARLVGLVAHQGVAADIAGRRAATLADLAGSDRNPLIVVLDGVEDPQNLGAILRSVDAAGATGLVRQARRSAPLTGAVARASAGAVHHVMVVEVVNVARALEQLKASGVWTVGLDAGAETPYDGLDLTLPTALVVGAEGRGLRRLVRERCDVVAAIPMAGHVSSLNVSAAAAVALFEAVRQRRSRGMSPPRPEPWARGRRSSAVDPGEGTGR